MAKRRSGQKNSDLCIRNEFKLAEIDVSVLTRVHTSPVRLLILHDLGATDDAISRERE